MCMYSCCNPFRASRKKCQLCRMPQACHNYLPTPRCGRWSVFGGMRCMMCVAGYYHKCTCSMWER